MFSIAHNNSHLPQTAKLKRKFECGWSISLLIFDSCKKESLIKLCQIAS